jgi:hypothetical protein
MMTKPLRQYLKAASEFLAIAAPIICLFDCVVLPILAAFLPFIGMHNILHGVSDQFITALVLAICMPVLVPGILKHKNKSVALMFASACCLMLFTNIVSENMDIVLHTILTTATSVLLIRANWLNKRLLATVPASTNCSCKHHH